MRFPIVAPDLGSLCVVAFVANASGTVGIAAVTPAGEKKRGYKLAKQVLQGRLVEATTHSDEDNLRARRPQLLSEGNRAAYFAMVDYLTAVLARYLYGCASSKYWHSQCFSVLAKWSAKLKALEKDPVDFARLSLEAAEDLDDEHDQVSMLDFMDKPRFSARRFLTDGGSEPNDPSTLYHTVESQFRDCLYYHMSKLTQDSFTTTIHNKNPEAMEVCTRVYRTGQQYSHAIIASDRTGEFSAATDPKQLRYTRAAFDILLRNSSKICKSASPLEAGEDDEPSRAKDDTVTIQWQWHVDESRRARDPGLRHAEEGKFVTSSIEDMVSVCIPHSLCDAHISIETMGLILVTRVAAQMLEDETLDEYVDEDFTAEFICTTASHQNMPKRLAVGRDSSSLKNATIFRNHILPGTRIAAANTSSDDPDVTSISHDAPSERSKNDLAKFNKQMEQTQSWKFDEKAVIVPCWTYVGTCLSIAVSIAICGLIIPFTVPIPISGADPLNIANISWFLSAFFLLLAQSRYVPDWKWHDFLQGRVVCRTVSELASVSRLPQQLVLHRLLMAEKSSALSTRGPFNSMFSRKSEDGFSVDVACMTSTLYASGFVLMLGIGKFERHVTCYDARPVSLLLEARHGEPKEVSLGCPLPLDVQYAESKLPVLKMTSEDFMTERVLGLYVGDREFG